MWGEKRRKEESPSPPKRERGEGRFIIFIGK